MTCQIPIKADDHVANRFSSIRTCCTEKCVWAPYAQIFEENLVQLVVMILPGVDQMMITVFVEFSQNAGKTNDFRSRADNRHDLHLRHNNYTFAAMVSGRL